MSNAARRFAASWIAVLALSVAAAQPARAQNPIVVENQLPGNPPSEWDISGSGDPTIQGFATDISVNRGGTIEFKIDTDATAYHIDIYRLGWYGGLGARKVTTTPVLPSATLPQVQPAPLYDATTGLTECGNWAVSASWTVPAGAVSGIYLARLVRDDTNGASHIVFIVRDDASTSDLLFQTSDATWQAYNTYGGNSLYQAGASAMPYGHANKVSYNRPFVTRASPTEDWLFNSEYPMLRWLEANGYDVTYSTNVDTDRRGARILQHKVFLSVGHDEYWSAAMRANVEAARDAGVHLAFFSGNEVYWKVRWENSTDGSGAPYRTLVCYKEGTLGELACGGKCDPDAAWTGLWRDGAAFSPPSDGNRPENALSGQISWDGSTGTIVVPSDYKDLRFWRNTPVAGLVGQSYTLAANTLGYEWDFEQYGAYYPPGRVRMSRTDSNGKTHHLSLYRAPSGALVFGAGTVQWSWGLDGTHDRGGSTPDPAMRQATLNLFAEMGAQPGSIQAGLVAAVPSGDASPPVSTIGFPLDGGTVVAQQTIQVSGTAVDAAGAIGGVEVSVDGGTTWAPATGGANWSFAWAPAAAGTATIRVRAVDDWGNREVAGPGITVTIDPPGAPSCPCNLWTAADVPSNPSANDGQAIEVGVKFRPLVDGFITGLRFYKGSGNTGTHEGHLWAADGTLLATAVFTGETASGWQETPLTTPVAVTAGVTYVASYHSAGGGYAFTNPYFTTAHESWPLRALASGEDGPNAVYQYSPTPAFPTSNYQTSNYWVDVVFATTNEPDTTPPTVVALSPGNNAGSVAATANVTASFSEAMDATTVSSATFELLDPAQVPVAATVSYNAATRTAVLDPSAALDYSTTYTARLRGGGADPAPRLKDLAGNALAADVTWSFTTAGPPPPPPDEGPGGPILVVSTATNPFSRYYAEILRAEGLNAFTASDVSLVTAGTLAAYDVVILGEMTLTAPQVQMFADWVNAGGNLVAMRPDAQLASLLGLTSAGGTLADRYLKFDTAAGPAQGLVAETVQFHGTADLWTLSGATAVATLYSAAGTPTAHPAVTLRSVGSNGGQAAAFAYDLARSVVYTRQGNPAWAGQERDGTAPKRSDDMFYGAAAGDVQPDWIDLGKVAIPQADEQQRLLANLVEAMNRDRKPLPRFWYFPRMHKAVVIMTGDNHGSAGMAPRFETYLAQSPANCSLPDWECVRASGYMFSGAPFTDAQAALYHAAGFEVGVHVNTNCSDWTETSLRGFYQSQLDAFAAQYPSVPAQVSNRTHCIAWSDWATQAKVERDHGIRLDTNYYFWPPGWVQNRPGMFTGSGLPMRFADLDGTMIDCYQAVTQMTDESGQDLPYTIATLLDRALGAEGYYGAFTANMHFDSAPHAGSDAIVAAAVARGVPVVSGRQMLEWLDARSASSYQNLAWSSGTLRFDVVAAAGARNLRGLLPTLGVAGTLTSLSRNGSPVAWTAETIKGVEYAIFDAQAGSYEASYAVDSTAPAITALTATPGPGGTATVTWTTDEPAGSHVDYGTAPGTLDQAADNAALVTGHSMPLSGLVAGATYYFRVTSADAASNSATAPAPPAAPASFTMPSAPCLVDATVADFAAGTASGTVALAAGGDGAVTLASPIAVDFDGTTLPAGWSSWPWTGGTSTVAGGVLTVDGARADPEPFTAGPGSTLEFTATFQAQASQHAGFGGGNHASPGEVFNTYPWAIFSTASSSTALYARTWNGGGMNDYLIPGSWLGTAHRYRIDWLSDRVRFWIDGTMVREDLISIAGPMRPAISDYNVGGGAVMVDWMRLTPYVSGGTFTSRVAGGGSPADWGAVTWTATVPAGTTLTLSARTGNTAVPDGSWSAFTPLASSGSSIGRNARYAQYRAEFASTDPALSPSLEDVALSCTAAPDLQPPLITNVAATPDPSGTAATITWTTDESATSRVDYGTSPGSLAPTPVNPALVTAHTVVLSGLLPNVTYHYRVVSADEAANSATEPAPPAAPLQFTTPSPPCLVDATQADFAAGTPDAGIAAAAIGDGALSLSGGHLVDFGGAALPAGWSSLAWGGGGATTVSGGQAHVDGARAWRSPAVGPGTVLEFTATFRAVRFQHIGFVSDTDFNAPWIIVSTGGDGGAVYARASDGTNITLAAGLRGAPHRYRIEWTSTGFNFSVDGGAYTATIPFAVSQNLLVLASDLDVDATPLDLDDLSIAPFASSGTFLSRVADAGASVTWVSGSWTADTPAGTAVALSVRTGDTPAPGAGWTSFTPLASSGAAVGTQGRYAQYRAQLSSADPLLTPVLRDVSLTCSACGGGPPAALADLAAARLEAGNDADGTTKVALSWTGAPGDAEVEVWRAGFGNYPTFAGGVVPAVPTSYPPGAPWTLAGAVTGASSLVDEVATRDAYHYVAFVKDACQQVSAASNRTAGVTNYVLGDVSNSETPGQGDNKVDISDLSLLGSHYGQGGATIATVPYLDVGPTTTGYIDGRPVPDQFLDFEDLILFAINFGVGVLPAGPLPVAAAEVVPAEADRIACEAPAHVNAGETFAATLRLSGTGRVQALSVKLAWDGAVAEPLDGAAAVTAASWLVEHGGIALSAAAGTVDVARLGARSLPLAGDGALATVRFRARTAGDPRIALAAAAARDARNRPLDIGLTAGGVGGGGPLPTVTALAAPRPNPFHGSTTVAFSLAERGAVTLTVYDAQGRAVRTLAHGVREPGNYEVAWDGRDGAGRAAAAGIYFVRLSAPGGPHVRKVLVQW